MSTMKRIRTAMTLDPSLKFLVFQLDSRRAMRRYINNPPAKSVPHLYVKDYMQLSLDYTGSTPIESTEPIDYIVMDSTTNAQKIVRVFGENIAVIGELKYQLLSIFNRPNYKWLRIQKIKGY